MRRILLGLVLLVSTSLFALPFTPLFQGSKTITCTSTSAATQLAVPVLPSQGQLEVQNAGTATIFMEAGTSTAVATVANSYPIFAGQSKIITVSNQVTHVACIVSSTSQTLIVSVGAGE